MATAKPFGRLLALSGAGESSPGCGSTVRSAICALAAIMRQGAGRVPLYQKRLHCASPIKRTGGLWRSLAEGYSFTLADGEGRSRSQGADERCGRETCPHAEAAGCSSGRHWRPERPTPCFIGYSAFRTYRHDGYRLQPKNWFPALLPDLAVLRTSGLPHLPQVVVLSKRCFK